MSYIRGIGNPEKLYIWGESDGRVTIMKGREHVGRVPRHIFEGIMLKFHEDFWDGSLKYRGAELVQCEKNLDFWTLKYKDVELTAYEVTWFYIAAGVKRRHSL